MRRLAHRAHEEQQADGGHHIDIVAEELHGLAGLPGRASEDRVEVDRAEDHEGREDAKREAEIADAVDDEGLDRGSIGGWALVPEADQQVGGETDALPAEEELQQVVRRHQHQHREGKERQVAEEARLMRIVAHIADRIDVNQARTRS